ncbi:MAG: hypothetical protein AAGF79_07725 [Pseudomonadota bacterium]
MEDLIVVIRYGLVAVGLWIVSRWWDLWRARKQRQDDRETFIRALFAEIEFNTIDLLRFIETKPDLKVFEDLFQNPSFVPHITDARHTDVYRSRITELHAVSEYLIADVVRFYGDLEKIKAQIDGLQHESFRRISVKGRVGTMANMYDTIKGSAELGAAIIACMEVDYTHLQLKRRAPLARLILDNDELQERLQALESDLDRVRARHR